jgi:hypothetical protein
VKDKPIQTLCPRPFDDSSKQHLGDTSSSPFRFGKYIDDDTVTTLGQSGPTERVRQSSLQMNAGTGDDTSWIIVGAGQPADILTTRERIMKAISRFSTKCLKQVGRYFTHVVEHARAMSGDRLRIRESGESNPE